MSRSRELSIAITFYFSTSQHSNKADITAFFFLSHLSHQCIFFAHVLLICSQISMTMTTTTTTCKLVFHCPLMHTRRTKGNWFCFFTFKYYIQIILIGTIGCLHMLLFHLLLHFFCFNGFSSLICIQLYNHRHSNRVAIYFSSTPSFLSTLHFFIFNFLF